MKTCYICDRPNSAHPRREQLAICSPCAKAWRIELKVELNPEPVEEPVYSLPEIDPEIDEDITRQLEAAFAPFR